MINNKTLQSIVLEVSKEFELPDDVIEVAYREYWNWVKDTLEKVPVNEPMSEEDFNNMQTSINVPSLGKFYATYSRCQFLNDKYNNGKKDVEDSRSDSSIHDDASNG